MIVDFTEALSVSYWLQERLIFIAQARDVYEKVKVWTNLHGSESNPLAVYDSVRSGALYKHEVDMTDYVRTYREVTHIYFKQDSVSREDITISIAGLINPASVLIPQHDLAVATICPPSLMYCDGVNKLAAELYPNFNTWMITGDAVLSSDKRQIKDILGDFTLSIYTGEHIDRRTFSTTPLVCSVSYALVRWVSFTGVQRVHYFMLRNQTIASAENYQLLTLDNYYDEIKGRVDGLDLYLDDLLPYDLWYYADVITSSKVEVSLDGQTWNQVQVTNKNVTIPTGEKGNGKLEITVNWKRYDAINM